MSSSRAIFEVVLSLGLGCALTACKGEQVAETRVDDNRIEPASNTRPAEPAGPAEPAPVERADPPWFSAHLFPGATVLKSGHTPPDSQGLSASQILFDLGTMPIEQCAEKVNATLQPIVGELKREAKGDGRLELTASAPDYDVTVQCGSAEGKTRAYVSYRWTK